MFLTLWIQRLASFLWIPLVGLGFGGWNRRLRSLFFPRFEKSAAGLLGFSMGLAFFSLYVFGLAANGILYWPLTALFFIPQLPEGWREWREGALSWPKPVKSNWALLLLVLPLLLWAFEYLSGPIVWDAILDHYRYAREVSRLHQTLFHWTNHTGDMPKAAELVLAGFWNLGGESLSKLFSALPAFFTSWLFLVFAREWKGSALRTAWIFWTCPFFLALYSWGYIEGFLAFFEVLALFCFWKSTEEPKKKEWPVLAAFFLGMAFAVKYTAVLAIVSIACMAIFRKIIRKAPLGIDGASLLAFSLPVLPWLLKNELAFGNPFYPLATSFFGSPVGYGPELERGLLADTGLPHWGNFLVPLWTIWNSFFTLSNAVGAAWTPLAAMGLPWFWSALKKRQGVFVFAFSTLFFLGWIFLSTSLRHACGGAVALVLLASMAWEEAFRRKAGAGILFGLGAACSLWLCLSAQLQTTAPYASALGLEDNLARLKRNYTYDSDTYAAYRFIEDHSDPWDRVVAFAVFQTYPLRRITFVDFKWKRPLFLQWASDCKTAQQLADLLHQKGVAYFLYQEWEAAAMSRLERDFDLQGMPKAEYVRFWRYYTEPAAVYENSTVYRVRATPLGSPRKLDQLPGLQEKGAKRL